MWAPPGLGASRGRRLVRSTVPMGTASEPLVIRHTTAGSWEVLVGNRGVLSPSSCAPAPASRRCAARCLTSIREGFPPHLTGCLKRCCPPFASRQQPGKAGRQPTSTSGEERPLVERAKRLGIFSVDLLCPTPITRRCTKPGHRAEKATSPPIGWPVTHALQGSLSSR